MLHGLLELHDAFAVNMDISRRGIKGQWQGTLPLSTFKDNLVARMHSVCTYTHPNKTKSMLCEVTRRKVSNSLTEPERVPGKA